MTSNRIAHFPVGTQKATNHLRIAVVGAGPVAMRFVAEMKRRGQPCDITLFGDEPHKPYNRAYLGQLLSRKKEFSDLNIRLPESTSTFKLNYVNQHIDKIDSRRYEVITPNGDVFPYDKLVLATGSRPHIPNIEGTQLEGVLTFRTIRDAEKLFARSFSSRRIVVVGGGLLGVEAAVALRKYHTDVILVQQSDRLMNHQLDHKASSILVAELAKQGIRVILSTGVRRIIGDQRVEKVITRDGSALSCDTVLLCTGIKPTIELAIEAGIHFSRGVIINDDLQTSKPDIYAIGECSQHHGNIYGMAPPGFEQASVLADQFSGGRSKYFGTQTATVMKIPGSQVCSMGEVEDLARRVKQQELTYINPRKKIYRKVVIHKGRVIGACAIGEWSEQRRVQEALLSKVKVYPWQRWLFIFTGRFWRKGSQQSVHLWPKDAVICQCNQITLGHISDAIAKGASSADSIVANTSAGAVCGSCKSLIENSLEGNHKEALTPDGASVTV